MTKKMKKIMMAAACAAVCANAAVAGEALSGPEGWLGKALLIEKMGAGPSGRWGPYKAVDLKKAAQASPSEAGPRIAVWSEGSARRVEIACGEQMFAWENLRPGASAQLEFGCEGGRYRAQVGSVVIERAQPAADATQASQRPAEPTASAEASAPAVAAEIGLEAVGVDKKEPPQGMGLNAAGIEGLAEQEGMGPGQKVDGSGGQ